jgi:hypothetical protein
VHQGLAPCNYRSAAELTLGSGVPQHLYGPNEVGVGTFWHDVTALTSGPALLKVSAQCRYNFRLVRSTDDGLVHDAQSGEPNDTPATAAPLTEGKTIYAQQPGIYNRDYYRVQFEAGAVYELGFALFSPCVVNGLSVQMNLGAEGTGQVLISARSFSFGSSSVQSAPASATGAALVYVETACPHELTLRRVL